MIDPVDEYLDRLRKALPTFLQRRLVPEIEDHLRESAAANGAEEAIARFGPATDLARAFKARAALHGVRLGGLLLILAMLPLALAVFPLPRDLLPAWGASSADRWPQQPIAVAGQQDLIAILLIASVVLVLCLVAAAVFRRVYLSLLLQGVALVAITALGVNVAVLAVRWRFALPSAPSLAWITAYMVAAVAIIALATLLSFRALRAAWAGCPASRLSPVE